MSAFKCLPVVYLATPLDAQAEPRQCSGVCTPADHVLSEPLSPDPGEGARALVTLHMTSTHRGRDPSADPGRPHAQNCYSHSPQNLKIT